MLFKYGAFDVQTNFNTSDVYTYANLYKDYIKIIKMQTYSQKG